jgi:hypothetical protein
MPAFDGAGSAPGANAPAARGAQAGAARGAMGLAPLLAVAGIVAATGLVLLSMGRTPICQCGYVKLWHGVVHSSENSQHLTDWYSFTHVIHGILFYAGLWLAARMTGLRMGLGLRLVLATLVEAGWETVENTDFVINRYREATIALDYYGDSVVNALVDILTMVAGFVIAARMPIWATALVAVTIEVVLAWSIRDNLTLNVVMLLWPLEGIKAWQGGA